jgi:transketolase
MLLYALLHLTGYPDMTLEQLKAFRKLGSIAAGHPEYGHAQGIETTTGPLGQGIANAVGMAIAQSHLAARFGADLVDHHTFVIAGDGCLMEGISQEAISLAGHLKLSKLIVLWDDNNISIDGSVGLSDSTNQALRFEASGWRVLHVDGHDLPAIDRTLTQAKESDRPTLVCCKTVIGFGAPKKAGTAKAHGEPLGAEELSATKAALGWYYGPFEVPPSILQSWREIGARGGVARLAWQAHHAAHPMRAAFDRALAAEVGDQAADLLLSHAIKVAHEKPTIATRAASGAALEALFDKVPELVGGSADLTGSNLTLVKGTQGFTADNPAGRYIYYGVREHAMAAIMNGMALHGGIVPYAGTFLCFADYSRPAIRLAALMGIRVVHVMTHDSIGLGEDGPTHQPVEHLAALRVIPNLAVFRPADAVETAECWALSIERTQGPSLLALSRQATPTLRTDASTNLSARGAYELAPAEGGTCKVALFATGTEVAVAMEARERLQSKGVPTRVVSCPSFELFEGQDEDYQASIIGPVEEWRIAVEAAVSQGWWETFEVDAFIGMDGFGASAPAKDLYRHFGITSEAIEATALELLNAE